MSKLKTRAPRRVPLAKCPFGLFLFQGILGIKTEYHTDGKSDAYCMSSGEYFWGGTNIPTEREALMVTPISYETAIAALDAQAKEGAKRKMRS
jgi:hypothetical protein